MMLTLVVTTEDKPVTSKEFACPNDQGVQEPTRQRNARLNMIEERSASILRAKKNISATD